MGVKVGKNGAIATHEILKRVNYGVQCTERMQGMLYLYSAKPGETYVEKTRQP